MRLLFIANDFPSPGRPGKGVFNLNLARALAQKHEVKVVAPLAWLDAWPDTLRAIARGAVDLRSFGRSVADGFEVRYPHYYYPPGMLRNQYGWFYWQSVRRTVESLAKVSPPDAVVAYWAHPDGEAGVRAARRSGVRSAVIVGGSDVLLLTADPGRRRRVVGVLLATDAVLCVSRHLRDKVLELGVPGHKVHVWRQGVDTEIFHPGDQAAARRKLGLPEGAKAAVWVGRMHPVKGLDVLLEALAILRGRGVALHVYLVGDGELRERLEAQVRTLKLGEMVTFAGARPQDQLPDWYRAADITLLPSRSEGLPNVLRESKACGTPFVASKVGGIAEIADEGLDQLVAPEDPGALAAAIEAALGQPRPAATEVHSTSWSASADALIAILTPHASGATDAVR